MPALSSSSRASADAAARPQVSVGRVARARLAHVDAMRPAKQVLVVSTHSLLTFAPGTLFVGAGILLLHVAREGFLFISACMLAYAYRDLRARDLGRFWRKRLVAVGAPYASWTVIYFLVGLPGSDLTPAAALGKFGWLLLTGYSQLYFLVVLLQFYVLFPLVAALLRKTARHHLAVALVSLAVQIGYMTAIHWGFVPRALTGTSATREVMSYQFYLLAGCIAALHYEAFHGWLVRHAKAVVAGTVVTAAGAEAWYWAGVHHLASFIGTSGAAFQPVVIPFNVCAIALIYLAGVLLVHPRRPALVARLTHIGVEDSYAVYLSQVLFVNALALVGWKHLDHVVPWPLIVAVAVVIVFSCGCLVGELLARTPLSRVLAGRSSVGLAWWQAQRRAPAAVATRATAATGAVE